MPVARLLTFRDGYHHLPSMPTTRSLSSSGAASSFLSDWAPSVGIRSIGFHVPPGPAGSSAESSPFGAGPLRVCSLRLALHPSTRNVLRMPWTQVVSLSQSGLYDCSRRVLRPIRYYRKDRGLATRTEAGKSAPSPGLSLPNGPSDKMTLPH
jgi:hypothetical protein